MFASFKNRVSLTLKVDERRTVDPIIGLRNKQLVGHEDSHKDCHKQG